MMAGYRPLRCDVLDVQLTRELNEPHFDIVGLGDTAGGRHHAFQSCGISRYEGRITALITGSRGSESCGSGVARLRNTGCTGRPTRWASGPSSSA